VSYRKKVTARGNELSLFLAKFWQNELSSFSNIVEK
jgi:hypothetical protein